MKLEKHRISFEIRCFYGWGRMIAPSLSQIASHFFLKEAVIYAYALFSDLIVAFDKVPPIETETITL